MKKFFSKKERKAFKLALGLELKRCAECSAHVRPCLASGKPAVFHRWVEDDQGRLQFESMLSNSDARALALVYRTEGFIPAGCGVEILRRTLALVEYPDGSVGKVNPELIDFQDREAKK